MSNILIRRSNERGYFDHGWLKSYHTFSFGDYYDPKFMNFGNLRVINDDVISPNTGFELHPHKNMEIITYILSGSLTHSDNLDNKEEIKTGEVQIMSAGSGITHSEWNNSNKECHLLQIWIKPNQIGGDPYYKIYQPDHFKKWALIASGEKNNDSIQIKQSAEVYVLNSQNLQDIELPKTNKDLTWIHIATGQVKIGENILNAGDAIGISGFDYFDRMSFLEPSKVLVFYL